MSDKPTLDALFAKAGLQRMPLRDEIFANGRQLANDLMRRRGKPKAMLFAMLFIKHHFNARRAYEEFVAGLGRQMPRNKGWAFKYADNETVKAYCEQILHDALERLKRETHDDVRNILDFNREMMYADVTGLLEQRREYQFDREGNRIPGSGRNVTYLRNLNELTHQQRCLIQGVTFNQDGVLTGVKAVSRVDLMKLQLQAAEVMHRLGAGGGDFVNDLKNRLGAARERRIALEVAAGKVVRLPTKETSNGGG